MRDRHGIGGARETLIKRAKITTTIPASVTTTQGDKYKTNTHKNTTTRIFSPHSDAPR